MKKLLFVTLISLMFIPVLTIQAKEIIIKNDVMNGTVTSDKQEAEEGEIVTLTVTPNEGYELKSISVLDKFDEMPVTVTNNSFEMPSYNVFISAEFEKIVGYTEPQNNAEETADNNSSTSTYIIFGAGALLIIIALIYIVIKKKK